MKATFIALLALVVAVGCGKKDVEKEMEGGFKETKDLAEKGDAKAQFNLGRMYYKGEGVEQDFKEAVKWFRKAAEQGYAAAQYSLGWMYDQGHGVMYDKVLAYAWWNLAAANGDALAKKNKDRFSDSQIAKGQELSREMLKKNPKLLK